MQLSSKKTEILDLAQELIQKRGYNGFSFADIAEGVEIRKASIFHHFPSKAALAAAVVCRYREDFLSHLDKIAVNKKTNWLDKIHCYAKLYEDVLDQRKLCLCGMLASEIESLPAEVKSEIQYFFNQNVTWLSKILVSHFFEMSKKRLNILAWQIISSLQGAVIMARMSGKQELFSSACEELIAQLRNLK
jgi:TetR/AcrR family transcriptional repressor of nem operon